MCDRAPRGQHLGSCDGFADELPCVGHERVEFALRVLPRPSLVSVQARSSTVSVDLLEAGSGACWGQKLVYAPVLAARREVDRALTGVVVHDGGAVIFEEADAPQFSGGGRSVEETGRG